VHVVSFNEFDAFVHMTPLVLVLVVCVVVYQSLVPPFVQFDASRVYSQLSYFDAFVHSTPLAAVLVLCTVVHHTLVPPICAV
jgi:hypothetical protein